MTKVFLLNKLEIKPLTRPDVPIMVSVFKDLGWNKPASQFEQYLQEQDIGERKVWVAWIENEFVGYNTLKWHSDYLSFKKNGIPEISDLNVLPKFRKNGIGSKLLNLAEKEAETRSPVVGIGVGLLPDYGNAQKLYIKKGYVPDGEGITYNNNPLIWGDKVTVDDDLVLWFTKKLKD